MKLHKSLRPHVRKHTSVRHMMIDIIVSLLLLMIVPIAVSYTHLDVYKRQHRR